MLTWYWTIGVASSNIDVKFFCHPFVASNSFIFSSVFVDAFFLNQRSSFCMMQSTLCSILPSVKFGTHYVLKTPSIVCSLWTAFVTPCFPCDTVVFETLLFYPFPGHSDPWFPFFPRLCYLASCFSLASSGFHDLPSCRFLLCLLSSSCMYGYRFHRLGFASSSKSCFPLPSLPLPVSFTSVFVIVVVNLNRCCFCSLSPLNFPPFVGLIVAVVEVVVATTHHCLLHHHLCHCHWPSRQRVASFTAVLPLLFCTARATSFSGQIRRKWKTYILGSFLL